MSKSLINSEILHLQRVCAVCGYYTGSLDGKWTADLDRAEAQFEQQQLDLQKRIGQFDARSEKNIATLLLPAQRVAREFMKAAASFGRTVKIISGSRTYAEQDALYAIGRTIETSKRPVTKAKGGQSNHNFGMAWDIGMFGIDGRYMDGSTIGDREAYERLATFLIPRVANLEWGGDWKKFVDPPHYQLATGGKSPSQIRILFESGKPIF